MTLIQSAENYIFDLFKDNLSDRHIYHNFNHTFRVCQSAEILLNHIPLSEKNRENLLLATWFHDTGYTVSDENHEEQSCRIARNFLTEKNVPEETIKEVERLIMATKFGHNPVDISEEIIRDADSSHFADENYLGISELLRSEWELTQNKFYTDLQWAISNRNLLSQCHRFYTDYAKENWQTLKEKNIVALQKKISKLSLPAEDEKISKKEKAPKPERPDRGIDTMFRVTLNNHTRLSEIADSKANILLSVNAILISIVLSVLIPKLDSPKNYHLILPAFVLLMSSVITIIFAILSTRPKVTSGEFTREEVENKKVNILFFGNFFKMPHSEYEWAMNELMKDREGLYNALTKDLYYLGLVLHRKYRLLRITYNIFMTGIIVSVIAFVWAFVKFNMGVE